MGLFDRFTRDEVSAKVWWPFALLLVVLAVTSFRLENRAVDGRRSEAATWSVSVIRGPVETSSPAGDVARPLNDADEAALTEALAEPLSNDAVDAIRIWAADGTLLYSSALGERAGSSEALNDDELRAVLADPASSLSVLSDRSLTGEPVEPLFLTYATFSGSPTTIGEVQLVEGQMLSDISDFWSRTRALIVVAALVTLGLALLSMREPVAPIGAGVRFYPESVPDHLVVMDREEEVALRQTGTQSRRRAGSVDQHVEELEASKLALEGELQRALSALAALRVQQGATPRAIPPAPVSEPEVDVVRLPESPLAEIEELDVTLAEEPETPARLRPVRSSTRAAESRTESHERADPDSAVEAEIEDSPAERDVSTHTAEKPLAEIESTTAAEPEGQLPPEEPEIGAARDLIVIPEAGPQPEPIPAAAPVPTRSKDEAVDVLNRLVSPTGSPAPSTVDPGEIRAKLARTAALKKPGSRERREEQERRARSEQDPH